jgi:ADP-ribose pyrophosphatase YjhB (NUDIX family)
LHPLLPFQYCPKCGSVRFEENNFKSKKCGNCGFIYYFNSSAATAAFITTADGKLLVVRRAKAPAQGTLDLPGGFVDMFETGEAAIIREVKEETSLIITNPRYLFSLPNIYVYSGFDVHTLDLFYECKIADFDNFKAGDDAAELYWLDKNEINPDLFGLNSIRQAIRIWLESCMA